MGIIRSWDDFEPEEGDYFNDRHKNARQESDNLGDTYDAQRKPEEAIKEVKAVRFAGVLSILIENGIFK